MSLATIRESPGLDKYLDGLEERLAAAVEECPGLVATVGAEALASLSDLALAAVAASARGDEGRNPPTNLRVGLLVARKVWSGKRDAPSWPATMVVTPCDTTASASRCFDSSQS